MQHQNGVIRRTMPSGTPPMDVNVVVGVDEEEAAAAAEAVDMASSTKSTFSRNCVLGCRVNKLALCRFPVHDPKRLHSWLKFFDISLERVDSIGGAANLRVCLKHFNQKQQMAKTRIKTTPTRLQKVALAATTKTATPAPPPPPSPTTTTANVKTTTATTNNNTAVQELKRQLNGDHLSNRTRSQCNASTIIVAAPKRTTSVSSATSTLSQISNDSQSDTDCIIATAITTIPLPSPPPPTPPPPAVSVEHAAISEKRISQETNNENNNNNNNNNNNVKSIALLNKLSSNGKRKVYMITEKSAEYKPNESVKRKMYLIMEDQNGVDKDGDGGAMPSLHMSNQTTTDNSNKRKKLTFYTDNINSELCTQKFEQILPEILNRIQQQNGIIQQQVTTNGHNISNIDLAMQEQQQRQEEQEQEQEEKVPITLPPKKNRIKIERNAQEDIVARNCAIRDERNGGGEYDMGNAVITAANTPVIVTNMQANGLSTRAGNNNNNKNNSIPDAVLTTISNRSNGKKSMQHTEKQINLSSDFLFLMKMLPKLESIPEPQKQQVKQCIESFIEQSAGDNHHEPAEY